MIEHNIYERGIKEGVDAITVKFVIEAIDEYWRKQEPSVYALDKRLDLSVSTLEHKIDLLDKKIDGVEEKLTIQIKGLDKRMDNLGKIIGGGFAFISTLMICGFTAIGWLIKG